VSAAGLPGPVALAWRFASRAHWGSGGRLARFGGASRQVRMRLSVILLLQGGSLNRSLCGRGATGALHAAGGASEAGGTQSVVEDHTLWDHEGIPLRRQPLRERFCAHSALDQGKVGQDVKNKTFIADSLRTSGTSTAEGAAPAARCSCGVLLLTVQRQSELRSTTFSG